MNFIYFYFYKLFFSIFNEKIYNFFENCILMFSNDKKDITLKLDLNLNVKSDSYNKITYFGIK